MPFLFLSLFQLDFSTDSLSENTQYLTDTIATYKQHLPKGNTGQ